MGEEIKNMLLELIQKWKAQAVEWDGCESYDQGLSTGLEMCADELEEKLK